MRRWGAPATFAAPLAATGVALYRGRRSADSVHRHLARRRASTSVVAASWTRGDEGGRVGASVMVGRDASGWLGMFLQAEPGGCSNGSHLVEGQGGKTSWGGGGGGGEEIHVKAKHGYNVQHRRSTL